MRLSKRDFLKSLGFAGAASAALAGDRPYTKQTPPEELAKTGERPEIARPPQLKWDYYDAIDDILYDRVTFEPGATLPALIRLFSTQLGQRCPYTGAIKFHSHTNMDMACQLPPPSAFWTKRIHVVLNPDISAADFQRARRFSWSFWIGPKVYARGPFATDAQRATLKDIFKRKAPSTRSSLEFPESKGLHILAQQCFYADITTSGYRYTPEYEPYTGLKVDPQGNGIEFLMAVEGIRWRGVQ